MVERAVLRGFLCGLNEPPHDLSSADADRKSFILPNQTVQGVMQTEIPLFVLSPLILGSKGRYNGSETTSKTGFFAKLGLLCPLHSTNGVHSSCTACII
ncbi:hypothetical protein PRIO_5600 [Paenibacillus riograndensis SBR5]|uniref:Uncharacterized protein n=1 Tax=Paenibacillus riograndensis SBR5 TaxID=1073571 RepID=A0A0E4HEC7_9BACL|nr:hypothetical protein PRIO_5600 [Paenibacillus riograndensis SBR5]